MHDIQQLTDQIEAANLGSVSSVKVIKHNDVDIIIVELETASPTKARTALRWLDLITARDMIASKYRSTDAETRLSIRGHFPSGVFVIIVVTFHDKHDAEQVKLINVHINDQRPVQLITRLASIEDKNDTRM
jgi:hypothetical protein